MFGPSFIGKRIYDFNYEELPSFKVVRDTATNAPSQHSALPSAALPETALSLDADPDITGSGKTVIPLLEQVFEEFPEFPIQLDIKADTPGLVEATLSLIRKYPGRCDLILIGSFIHSVNTRIYQLAPDLPLFASSKRLLYLLGCYYLGVLRFAHIYESAIIIPGGYLWLSPLDGSITL